MCSASIHALAAVSCDLLLHLCLIPHRPGTASDACEARSKEPFWEVSDSGVKQDVYLGLSFAH